MQLFLTKQRRAASLGALALVAILLMQSFSLVSGRAMAAPLAQTDGRYFTGTQHYVSGAFLAAYDSMGGAARFGAPLTEAWTDNGTSFQLFENARMEQAAGAGVTLTALGRNATAGRAADAPVSVGADGPGGQYVLETGHTVKEPFLTHWLNNDGWWRLGKPISELTAEGSLQAQYFQFAKLITDDRRADGIREQLQDNARDGGSPFAAVAASTDAGAFFNAGTGHNVKGGFLEVYNGVGGAASMGAPLTEETTENAITVQYFEFGKLEYYADRAPGQRVVLAPLGSDWLIANGAPAEALQPKDAPQATPTALPTETATPAPTATPAAPSISGVPEGWHEIARGSSKFAGSSANRTKNIRLAAKNIDGTMIAAGATFSFNRALGDDSARAGFAPSPVIYGGRLIEGIGGGICQVSTTVFRAAFYAGFDIVSRKNHSFRISWYEPPLGLDATVFSDEGLDLKWRNTLGAPVLLKTIYNGNQGTLDVVLYSTADRIYDVALDGPYTANVVKHGPPLYEDDPSLPAGKLQLVEVAKDGIDVTINRVMTNRSTGAVVKQRIFSHYVPWRDVYKRGTGGKGGSTVTVQKP